VPQTASLMRTGTGSREGSTEPKTDKQPPEPPPPQPQQYGGSRSGIISVPPMQDYGPSNAYEPTVNEQANFVEPVEEQQQQQQPEDTADQQQYV